MLPPMQPADFNVVRQRYYAVRRTFSDYSIVFQEVSDRLMARLDLLAVNPGRILDLGCHGGYQFPALRSKFAKAEIIGTDPVASHHVGPQRTRLVAADPHCLPFDDAAFDLVVCNLMLPWCHDPGVVFAEVARVLSQNGAFMFTSAGPDTLQEYADAWSRVDEAAHRFGLEDMHQTGDALLSAGFAAPVLDRENIMIDYPSIDALQAELRHVGASNIASGRRTGLMSPMVRKKLTETVGNGRFTTTLELVHGHGWKGDLQHGRKESSDEYTVSLDSLRQSLRS